MVVLETGFIFLLQISSCEIIVFLENLEVILLKEIKKKIKSGACLLYKELVQKSVGDVCIVCFNCSVIMLLKQPYFLKT